jgi:hypothetical protein
MSEEEKSYSYEVCEAARDVKLGEQLPATLVQNEHVILTGRAKVEAARDCAVFWPSDQRPVHINEAPIVLRVLGNSEPIQVLGLRRCDLSSWPHWHLDL